MLHIVIAETELELVPERLHKDTVITASAERAGNEPRHMLLESTHHHRATWKLPDGRRRGRPDILHFCLVTALHSVTNSKDHLRLHVHTRHDKVITINRYTRIPKDFNRFAGLMRQLLIEGAVPPQQPLLELTDMTLDELLEQEKPSKVFILSKKGKRMSPRVLGRQLAKEKRPIVVIGGFPHGEFDRKHRDEENVISIYESGLPAWTVLSTVLHAYEDAKGLFSGKG